MTATHQIPPEKIHESPFNRRRAWGDLQELADSIKQVGVLEDLLARPHPTIKGEYELVFGHRRLRGSKLAGVATVPVKVRKMTDDAVMDAQIVENLQREDPHPLDEAETYEQLIKAGRTANEIAARVGKHPSYVHQRLKLLTLCEDVRVAFAEDRISTAVAVLIARVPTQTMQIEVLRDVAADQWTEARPAAEVRRIIESGYMLQLAKAPFDQGECATCPKRTGNQPELFADVQRPDTCTDPTCYESKQKEHFEGLLADAKKRGLPVLSGREATQQIDSARWSRSSEFIDLDTEVYDDSDDEELEEEFDDDEAADDRPVREPPPRKTYRELLAGAGLDITIAQEASGKLHELVPRDAVAKILPSEKSKGEPVRTSGDFAKEQREKAAKQRAKTAATVAAIVAEASLQAGAESGFWVFLGKLMIEFAHHDTRAEVCKRRGLEVPEVKRQYGNGSGKSYDYEKALRVALDKMRTGEQKALCIELLVSRTAYYVGSDGLSDALKMAVEHYGIDMKKVGAAAREATKKKPAKKGAKKAAKKGARS